MRRWMFLFVPLLVAGCATWGQTGFDGGQSFANRSDRSLTPSNVSQLHEMWKLPGIQSVVGGGYVFVTGQPNRLALVAYPESGCAGSGVPTCTESWSTPGNYGRVATDGTSVFAFDLTTHVMHVFGVDGTPKWTYTLTPGVSSNVSVNNVLHIADGRLWFMTQESRFGSGTLVSRLIAVPTTGCGASSCVASLEIPGNLVLDFVVNEGVVLATRQTDPQGAVNGHVYAYDPATGAERWRSHEYARVTSVRDGRVVAIKSCQKVGCTPGIVFPIRAGSNCTGTPTTCTAIASYPALTVGPVLTADHTVVVSDHSATWYGSTCTRRCTPLASFDLPLNASEFAYGASGGVVFTTGSPGPGVSRIHAFDDSLANCPGGTCVPTWTTDTPTPVHDLAVTNGRLYAAERDGFVHVYGL